MDKDGRTIQELSYDCRNRLVEAGGITYTYDAENTRTAETREGQTTWYVTDTGGSLSRMPTAYEADGSTTSYYYGVGGLEAQYAGRTGETLYYHFDNVGSTTMLTDAQGTVVERFAYGVYGELLGTVKHAVRFLYNGSYSVVTDENGLYYMRARYYNPDIKRFINQDIKVGDIGNSQSLNRYAYCEGNPVSLVDPFGLSPQSTQDQGTKSKYEKIHNWLGRGGVFFDGFDIINGILYLKEGNYVDGIISLACGLPSVGTVVGTVVAGARLVKYAKTAEKIAKVCRDVGKIGNTAAGAKAVYDTYQTAKRECQTAGGVAAYVAASVTVGYLTGKAAGWGADKLKNLASKAIPRIKTALQENAGKLINKVNAGWESYLSMCGKTNRGSVYLPFGKGLRGLLSDYLGKSVNIENGKFYSIMNKSGGQVFVSTKNILQSDITEIVSMTEGNINIISGRYGDWMDNVRLEPKFYTDDVE